MSQLLLSHLQGNSTLFGIVVKKWKKSWSIHTALKQTNFAGNPRKKHFLIIFPVAGILTFWGLSRMRGLFEPVVNLDG